MNYKSGSSSEGCNIPGRGYHKEVYANKPVKVTEAVDKWEDFLGPGEYTDIHPRTGLKDPDRIFSADGKRSIRFGSHEMNLKPSKFEIYKNGKWGYACENKSVSGTFLSKTEIPPLEDINADVQFTAYEIDKEYFESIWSKAVKNISSHKKVVINVAA